MKCFDVTDAAKRDYINTIQLIQCNFVYELLIFTPPPHIYKVDWSLSQNLLFCQCFGMPLQCTGYCSIFSIFFFQMYRFLPGFESLLWNIMKMTNIVFANDKK